MSAISNIAIIIRICRHRYGLIIRNFSPVFLFFCSATHSRHYSVLRIYLAINTLILTFPKIKCHFLPPVFYLIYSNNFYKLHSLLNLSFFLEMYLLPDCTDRISHFLFLFQNESVFSKIHLLTFLILLHSSSSTPPQTRILFLVNPFFTYSHSTS